MKFAFQTDGESQLYCEQIAKAMEVLYDIDPIKGIELLNDNWRGYDWREVSKTNNCTYVLYHSLQVEWAERIGNPRPYGGTEAELAEWKLRQDEAEGRLAKFRETGQHQWLWPIS